MTIQFNRRGDRELMLCHPGRLAKRGVRDPSNPVAEIYDLRLPTPPQGYLGPGARALRRSAGMTMEMAAQRAVLSERQKLPLQDRPCGCVKPRGRMGRQGWAFG